jgi:type IX secretion system PorP/SprF family membrane protein
MYDKIGIERNTLFIGNYAYRIISPRGVFSLGLSAGLRLQNEALQELRKLDIDDQYLPLSSRTYVLPDFNIGFLYRNDRYRAGLSMVSLLSYRMNTDKGGYHFNLNLRETNYMIYGDYLYSRIEGIALNPGVLLKVNPAGAAQIDLNLNVMFRERFWLGAGYRSPGGLIWTIQFMANDQARIAYSYGMDFSSLGSYHRGSHEIMLKYVFNYIVEAVDPRQF